MSAVSVQDPLFLKFINVPQKFLVFNLVLKEKDDNFLCCICKS